MRAALAGLAVSLVAAGCGGSPARSVVRHNVLEEYGCLNCHVYRGRGASNLGGQDLSHEGRRGRGIQWQIRHLKCPACLVPGSAMPRFDALDRHNLRRLALFLEHSR